MQDALQENHLIINIAAYKTMVESVLPWYDKINAMAKEYAYFSSAARDHFPIDHVIKFQHIGVWSVAEAFFDTGVCFQVSCSLSSHSIHIDSLAGASEVACMFLWRAVVYVDGALSMHARLRGVVVQSTSYSQSSCIDEASTIFKTSSPKSAG